MCEVPPGARIELALRDGDGDILGNFRRLRAEFPDALFAMNAGMYHRNRDPVGLYVEDGVQETPIVTSDGPGNFGMLPNGVFCVLPDGTGRVIESRAFAADPPACRHATQSGPALLLDGRLHPRFIPDSTFRNIRNGVGTGGGRTVFAISETQVTFHELATLFREMGLTDALYFDGRISRLYAPALGREDYGSTMGPIVAVRP